MSKRSHIDSRKIQILGLVVKEYIQTGNVTGSKSLVKNQENLQVSPATVRNDMKSLEDMGLIYQPYNSAGRLPTTPGIRMYVDYLMDVFPRNYLEVQNTKHEHEDLQIDHTYELIDKLAKTTGEIAFACFPDTKQLYYVGVSSFLQKNSEELGKKVFDVIDVLENRYMFMRTLLGLDVSQRLSVYIGEENVIPQLSECSLTVKRVSFRWHEGFLGILGGKRTDYAFNISALRSLLD